MVFFFYFFFFPSTTNTPCHPDGVPRTRGDEWSRASAPFILTLFLTLTPCFELQFCVFRFMFSFLLSSPSFFLHRGRLDSSSFLTFNESKKCFQLPKTMFRSS